jgi:hypothetical protein
VTRVSDARIDEPTLQALPACTREDASAAEIESARPRLDRIHAGKPNRRPVFVKREPPVFDCRRPQWQITRQAGDLQVDQRFLVADRPADADHVAFAISARAIVAAVPDSMWRMN